MDRSPFVGQPCQSARAHERGASPPRDGTTRVLCGLPSDFVWLGIDPLALGLTVAQLKKYKPSTLLLCADCAMDMAHDFAWYIRDGKARLERLTVQPLRISCHECHAVVKVMWDQDAPQFNPGAIQFCPRCGARSVAAIDPEADYWDLMVEAFDNMPLQLLKMLYAEWPRHDRRYHRFRDYVADQIAQYDSSEGETFEAAESAG